MLGVGTTMMEINLAFFNLEIMTLRTLFPKISINSPQTPFDKYETVPLLLFA